MPRPEQVIPSAGDQAPHGADAALQRLAGAEPLAPDQPQPPQTSPAVPSGPAPVSTTSPDQQLQLQGDLNQGLDSVLFGPSNRPSEPITAGVPFGAGTSFVPRPEETDQTFLERVAQELDSSPAATPDVKAFAERIRRGE